MDLWYNYKSKWQVLTCLLYIIQFSQDEDITNKDHSISVVYQ